MKRIGNHHIWWEILWDPTHLLIGVYWVIKDSLYGSSIGQIKEELHIFIGVFPSLQLHIIKALKGGSKTYG